MKHLAGVLSLLSLFSLVSCGAEAGDNPPGSAIDQTTVKGLVEGIFASARSGDLAALAGVADPIEADGDARQVAEVAKAPAEKQADFKKHFAMGAIRGACVRRDGKWYLQSF